MEGKPKLLRRPFVGILKKLFPLILALASTSCSTLGYVVDQGVGQVKLLNRARPVEEVLQSPYTPEHTKWAIREVQQAKNFAVQAIGLKATASYKNFVALDEPYVTYVVSAADPLKLESRTWHFWFVGEIPYLGFFQKTKAKAFAEKLKNSETPPLDTWVRGASAFSSLGWFPDPLYSSMIAEATEREIFDVVIHESVHATVWIKGDVDFNETLANFVGMQGSLAYLRANAPEKLKEANADLERERRFAEFIQSQVARYKQEVHSFEEKQKFYAGLPAAWEKIMGSALGPHHRVPKFSEWNNAALLSYGNYYRDYSVFEKVLKVCGGDLKRFVAWVKLLNEKGELNSSPLERLARMASETCP